MKSGRKKNLLEGTGNNSTNENLVSVESSESTDNIEPTTIDNENISEKDTETPVAQSEVTAPTELDIDTQVTIYGIGREKLMEFDISDPITEPTSVADSESDTYEDSDIIRMEIESSSQTPSVPSNETVAASEDKSIKEHTRMRDQAEKLRMIMETLKNRKVAPPNDESKLVNNQNNDQDINIELGENVQSIPNNLDNVHNFIIKESSLNVHVNTSEINVTTINSSEDYLKHQHKIMDNRCISFYWPMQGPDLFGSKVSISSEKNDIFVIDLEKIDINLLNVLTNSQRPIKIFYNAKPIIKWCIKNNLTINYIFDITTAVDILTDGKYNDNSLTYLLSRYSDFKLETEELSIHNFTGISRFLLGFRKPLVEAFETLGITKILNLEQRIVFALASSEMNGMPYNEIEPNIQLKNIWDLLESKYGVTNKKELIDTAKILTLNNSYLSERKDLLEVAEYINAENSEKICSKFDKKYVVENRVISSLRYGQAGSIQTDNYSFEGEGKYSFIVPNESSCLVEGRFIDLEIRVIAKLLHNSELQKSFYADYGPFAYFAAPLFDKDITSTSIDERYIARILLESIVRDFGDRETLFYFWNNYNSYLKEDEILILKEKFRTVHSELMNLIEGTQQEAKNSGYVTISTGRLSVIKNPNKAFYVKVKMYLNEIFKRSLDLSYSEITDYNENYTPKIMLCTIYNRVITLECDKSIVNNAIDIISRNFSKAGAKLLKGLPIILKVNATNEWEV